MAYAHGFVVKGPDRIGGARIALVLLFVDAAGVALIWLASSYVVVAVGYQFALSYRTPSSNYSPAGSRL